MTKIKRQQEKILKTITRGSKAQVTASIDLKSPEVKEILKSVKEAEANAIKRKQLSWSEVSSVRVRI